MIQFFEVPKFHVLELNKINLIILSLTATCHSTAIIFVRVIFEIMIFFCKIKGLVG